jgi:hypothetical protein
MFEEMRAKAIIGCNPCPTGVIEGIQKLEDDFKDALK